MDVRIERLSAEREGDFFALHGLSNGAGWCFCSAWWVPTWDGWGERSVQQNRALRERLFARGEHDGYLAYAGAAGVGWCQVGPRDRLAKLCAGFELAPEEGVHAISCFFVAPRWRRRGVARRLLAAVVADLRSRGARAVEAYPKEADPEDELDLWNGPRPLFEAAGFRRAARGEQRSRWRLELG